MELHDIAVAHDVILSHTLAIELPASPYAGVLERVGQIPMDELRDVVDRFTFEDGKRPVLVRRASRRFCIHADDPEPAG